MNNSKKMNNKVNISNIPMNFLDIYYINNNNTRFSEINRNNIARNFPGNNINEN